MLTGDFENMAERVGFEFTRKRSFNNIERTAGKVKQWKAVVSSANGSQTDHSLSDHLKAATKVAGTFMFTVSFPIEAGLVCSGLRPSQTSNLRVAETRHNP